jgi:PKD repeat protein
MITYLWDFGDGTTSTEQAPVHVYETPGVYTVTFTAASGSITVTRQHTVTVTEPEEE